MVVLTAYAQFVLTKSYLLTLSGVHLLDRNMSKTFACLTEIRNPSGFIGGLVGCSQVMEDNELLLKSRRHLASSYAVRQKFYVFRSETCTQIYPQNGTVENTSTSRDI